MSYTKAIPQDYPTFADLPVRYIYGDDVSCRLAVHVSGRFTVEQPPLICIGSFNRNMSDFSDFKRHYRTMASVDWPIVLVDLAGRGRSSPRPNMSAYSAVADAHDIANIARALGISSAVFIGQGHGGQVAMSLAAQHPTLIAGAVLINAGPTTEPHGLVRLRSNLQHIAKIQGEEHVRHVMRQMLSKDYPILKEEELDILSARTHFVDERGRVHGLFDPELIKFLERFTPDDEFEPQWHLFDALAATPLMLIRSQLSDRLSNNTFEEMINRRPTSVVDNFVGEGSPALLNNEGEVSSIADFVALCGGSRRRSFWT